MYRAIWNFFLISKFNVLYRAWEKESHNAFVLRGDPPSMRKRSKEISQWRRVEDMTRHVTRRWRSDMTHDTTMKTWYETWHDVKYVTHDVTLKTRVPLGQVSNNIYTIFFLVDGIEERWSWKQRKMLDNLGARTSRIGRWWTVGVGIGLCVGLGHIPGQVARNHLKRERNHYNKWNRLSSSKRDFPSFQWWPSNSIRKGEKGG